MPSQSPLTTMPQRHHHHNGGLQGPRPATLKVTKRPPRQPVIIYVESPKVVHAHPGEFKSVVQRLTGAPPPPSSSAMAMPALLEFPLQLYGQMAPLLVATSSSMSPPSYQLPPRFCCGEISGATYISSDVDDQLMIKRPAAGAAANPVAGGAAALGGACYYYHGGDISLRTCQPAMTNDR